MASDTCICGGSRSQPNPDCERCGLVAEIDRLRAELARYHEYYTPTTWPQVPLADRLRIEGRMLRKGDLYREAAEAIDRLRDRVAGLETALEEIGREKQLGPEMTELVHGRSAHAIAREALRRSRTVGLDTPATEGTTDAE